MTKLEKLYSIIENSNDVGVKLTDDVIQQVEELEEKIIKEEILPSLSGDIAPRLKPIKRDLVLVVEYHPGKDISVALSRKAKVVETLGAKPLELDPQVQHKESKKGSAKPHIAPRTGLCVYLPDGSVIQEKKASETFVKAIQQAGVLKVRELGYSYSRVPLVSNTIDKKYGSTQHPVGNGFYVFTNTCTAKKKEQLDRISKALNLDWSVEIVK